MNKNIILTCALATTLLVGSCSEDFLVVQSPSQLPVSEYYTTEERIKECLFAAYDPLQWCDYVFGQYTNLGMISDVMSDDMAVGGADANDIQFLHRLYNYNAEPLQTASALWTTLYSGVKRSNDVLEQIDNVKDISAENKALYIAEAKVLRAFYYKWLWKLWGNVPYYEKNLTDPYRAEQLNPDEVYAGIIATLEDAIKNGGLPMRQTPEWSGRVTLAMTYMLYAEVVMYQNDASRYNTALGYMDEIIESGQYSLVNNYASLWETSGEWCTESIFEINYFSTNGVRDWGNAMGEGGTVYPKLIGINGLSTNDYYDGGWGFSPVRQETYDLFSDNDQRKDVSILNFEKFSAETGATYSPRYEDEGNFLKKYLPRKGGNSGASASLDMNYNNNFRVYRYAETLLNAAELVTLGASGGKQSADYYLNLVHQRAIPGDDALAANSTTIAIERRKEFVGEGKRYWDLVRTNQAVSVLVAKGTRTNNWQVSKKYIPIPQSEIDADPNLVQNNY